MDQSLQNFFNQLHALIGLDTPVGCKEATQKLERATILKSMEYCMQSLPLEDRQQFDRMMHENPQPTPDAITQFFQSKLSRTQIEQCFKTATQQVVRQYMATLLTTLTESQKASISSKLGELLKETDPEMLREVMQQAKLST